ncbi:MAG: gliding motility-associated C-terminal domain-containing protein [Sphingobacteriales bacterium JAD_PAG50586_3]|nr:MAG: gliding motility-associated C-terminal domain-containing protein [Sphingobacteriales bacterium JAD_PAG50586_3]
MEYRRYYPEITVDSAGAYFITVTAANGCADTVTITVDEVECSFGDLPNVFTPNGDGFNDTFTFDIEGADNITVQIFNRWGNLVRVLDGESVSWDGTTNAGNMVSEGVYYYIGQAKLINGKQLEVAGYIQVLN